MPTFTYEVEVTCDDEIAVRDIFALQDALSEHAADFVTGLGAQPTVQVWSTGTHEDRED